MADGFRELVRDDAVPEHTQNPELELDDEILDLAGGAQDAIARHRAEQREGRSRGETPPTHTCKLPPTVPRLPRRERTFASFLPPAPSAAAASSAPPKIPNTAKNATNMDAKHWKQQVVELVYWRDLQRTGVVFGSSLFLLLSLSTCSIVSVLSYVSLALLSVTVSFRIYKAIIQAVQKSDHGHPFKTYLEQDVAIPADVVHKYGDAALVHINTGVKELRRLFLVEDLVDSLKFAVLMWILTYIGALFNGLTLIIVAYVGMFTWPVVYERHQTQIDHYYGLVNKHVKELLKKVQTKVPGAKPKTE